MTETQSEVIKAFQNRPSQAESNYIPLSAAAGEACANCRFFMNDGCWIIANEPEPIIATGYCDRWEVTPEPMPDMAEMVTEVVSEAMDTMMEAMPMMSVEMSADSKPTRKSFVDRLRDLLTPKPKDEAFSVFKGTDGAWHWHAVFTNNFEDREGEILTEKAHDNYITRVDMGLVPMPVLMGWHTPGTEHGEADMLWRSGHFVHAVGHFDDSPIAEKAIAFYRKHVGKIKMSHGFVAPEWAFDGKHYDDYNTIEITTLPPYAAANPYTSFEELKTMQKEMSDEKRRYLEGLAGKEAATKIIADSEQRGKALEELKVEYKDHAAVTPSQPAEVKPETEKGLASVFSDIVTMQSEMFDVMQLQAKALKAKDETIAALKIEKDTQVSDLQKAIDELRTIVNAPPSRASQSPRTTVTKADGLENKTPTAPDTFFGDLFAPAPNGAK